MLWISTTTLIALMKILKVLLFVRLKKQYSKLYFLYYIPCCVLLSRTLLLGASGTSGQDTFSQSDPWGTQDEEIFKDMSNTLCV